MTEQQAPRPCCSVGARADVPQIDAALRAARGGVPGAESLNGIYRRTGIRKATLIDHRDQCLAAGTNHPVPATDQSGIEAEPAQVPGRSIWAVPNPQDDPPTAPRKVISVTIERDAVRLRAKGRSYVDIGAELGISPDTAMDAVERVLLRTRRGADEQAEAARRLDLGRIDQLLAGLWDRATDPSMVAVEVPADTETGVRAYDGQDKAVDRVTRLLERRAKLIGYDAPITTRLLVHQAPGFDQFLAVVLGSIQRRAPEILAGVREDLQAHLGGERALRVLPGGQAA